MTDLIPEDDKERVLRFFAVFNSNDISSVQILGGSIQMQGSSSPPDTRKDFDDIISKYSDYFSQKANLFDDGEMASLQTRLEEEIESLAHKCMMAINVPELKSKKFNHESKIMDLYLELVQVARNFLKNGDDIPSVSEKKKRPQKPQIEFSELLGSLTFQGYSYKPTKDVQKKAMRKLWENRRDDTIGKKGEPLPLYAFGSGSEFEGINSSQKFQIKLKDDANFKERFKSFRTGIRREIKKQKIPVLINTVGGGILMTILDNKNG